MKKIFVLIACVCLSFALHAQMAHQVSGTTSENKILTGADWQADLRYLQQVVHKDYSFLFKNITPRAFDAAAEKLYEAMPAMLPHERLAGLARMVSLFKYGHTDISWREAAVKYHVVPLNFYSFSDGIHVEGAAGEYAELLGAKLIKVDGKLLKEVLQILKPLVPAENDQYYKAYGLDFLLIPEALHAQGITPQLRRSVKYTFEKDNKTFDKEITAAEAFRLPRTYGYVNTNTGWLTVRDTSSTPHYLKNLKKIYYYEYLPASKTLYVRHSQIQDDEENIPDFYKKVFDFVDKNDVEKLVLDVRLNGGGNNYKNKPIVTGIIESKKINKAGKFFVIIGRRTFSACQNLVNELTNYTNAVFVGEPTAENINFYGDSRRVELPNTKIPVFLSFAWWQDKPQWENAPWLAPHVAVEMSMNEYRTNKDPMLQACLDFKDADMVLDPMGRLRALFMAGKLDQVETEATQMVADPKYKYVNFEDKINKSGYDMLNTGRLSEAVYIFQLNTKLYPGSANTFDSLGEAYWKTKERAKAIEAYNKAISLDPGGATGQNSREMLKKIKAEPDHP